MSFDIGALISKGPGELARELCDAVLPPDCKFVGDIASGAVNYLSGDYVALAQDGASLMEDLSADEDVPALPGAAEPSPPPSEATAQTGSSSPAPAGDASGKDSHHAIESAGKNAAADFIAKFKDPDAFMNEIKNGQLPEAVTDSQSGMMMIQQHMQDLQRMTQLLTNMMQAMHEMEMGIVRNIRA